MEAYIELSLYDFQVYIRPVKGKLFFIECCKCRLHLSYASVAVAKRIIDLEVRFGYALGKNKRKEMSRESEGQREQGRKTRDWGERRRMRESCVSRGIGLSSVGIYIPKSV